MKKRTRRQRRNEFLACLLFMAIIVLGGFHLLNNMELYSSVARSSLCEEIEKGDQQAIDYYKSHYIEKDKYLYNGPMTIKFMAEKYGLNDEVLYEIYKASELTAQEFYKEFIKSGVIQEFYEQEREMGGY